jgi:hypothetical protein
VHKQTLTTPVYTPAFDRPLTADDRALLAHVAQFGASGYPIQRYTWSGTTKWTWTFLNLGSPILFATKREAVESIERYLGVLADCVRAEAEQPPTS